jgi:hypothetical protein
MNGSRPLPGHLKSCTQMPKAAVDEIPPASRKPGRFIKG